MHIRPAQHSDIDELIRLLHQVEDVHYQARPDLFVQGGIKHFPHELEQLLTDPNQPIFVAVADEGDSSKTPLHQQTQGEQILGYAMCIWHHHDGSHALAQELSLHIDDLCVDQEARGLGVGTALYRHVRELAREAGARRITLNVWEGNPEARAFYDHLGFRAFSHNLEQLL